MKHKIGMIGCVDGVKNGVVVECHGSFTQSCNGHPNSMAFVRQGSNIAVIHSARWDTGSDYTYIDTSKAGALNADPHSRISAVGIGGDIQSGHSYTVTLELPGGIRISNIDIGELDLSSLRDCDAIIGMDVIRQGKLTVMNDSFSFEV